MKKSKKIAVGPATGPNADINLTPLIDVVLVLLIIFMVVTPLLEKDIVVSVPNTDKPVEQHDVPPDQLVVKLLASGDVTLNGNKIEDSEYIGKLEAVFKKKPNPRDRIVFILAEDGANYGKLVHLFDGARQAGADTLGLITDDPDKP